MPVCLWHACYLTVQRSLRLLLPCVEQIIRANREGLGWPKAMLEQQRNSIGSMQTLQASPRHEGSLKSQGDGWHHEAGR